MTHQQITQDVQRFIARGGRIKRAMPQVEKRKASFTRAPARVRGVRKCVREEEAVEVYL